MACNCTNRFGFPVTFSLRDLNLDIIALGDGDVDALLLGDLPGHGDDDVPGDVPALLDGGVTTHLLLHRRLHDLVHGAAPLDPDGVALLLGLPVGDVPADPAGHVHAHGARHLAVHLPGHIVTG